MHGAKLSGLISSGGIVMATLPREVDTGAHTTMSQDILRPESPWQHLPESYFAPPTAEDIRRLREDILRYAEDDLGISPERAEFYADVFSARYE